MITSFERQEVILRPEVMDWLPAVGYWLLSGRVSRESRKYEKLDYTTREDAPLVYFEYQVFSNAGLFVGFAIGAAYVKDAVGRFF